jgi:signal transduction histidine kinase
MSIQPRTDLKSTAPTHVSWNAMNPFGARDLTALAATLLPAGPSARKALIATAPRGKARTSEGCQDDLASVEGLTAALRRARDRAEIVSRAKRPLLAGAHRDLREPLTAMLRLNSDWDARGTDTVAVRMIEQQRQALEVMADLIDSFLTIAEPEIAQPPAQLTDLESRSTGGKLCEASATPEPRAEEWSAEWSMISAVDRPEVRRTQPGSSSAERLVKSHRRILTQRARVRWLPFMFTRIPA